MAKVFDMLLNDRRVQGTVGFNTAFLWTCTLEKPKHLATAELTPCQLRILGQWCLSTADAMEKENG